jgi:hypothetical protein
MQYISEILSLSGTLLVTWGGFRYLIKPGLIAKFCLTRHDAGASKIHDITCSACYIVAGFFLFLLSSLTALFEINAFFLYIFVVLIFAGACAWILFLAPKKISEREKEQLSRILRTFQTTGKEDAS